MKKKTFQAAHEVAQRVGSTKIDYTDIDRNVADRRI